MKTIARTGLVGAVCLAGAIAWAQLPTAPALDPLAAVVGEEFDEQYLRLMAEHHRQGVELARLAEQRGRRAEVKEIARRGAGEQQKEIQEITQLLARPAEARSGLGRVGIEDGVIPPVRADRSDAPNTTPADDLMAQRKQTMAKLQQAQGEEFDRQFLRALVAHHQAGFAMNQAAAGRAADREVAAFARKSATRQQEEIEALNARYAEWFR